MLEPTHRQSFLDVLRPPPGYRLAAAVGTTYSLELEPLTAALLAFIGEDLDPDAPDRISVLHALSRVSRCLRVYVNAGSLPVDSSHRLNRLFALYDGVVRQVHLEGASFHPKLWVLKFEPPSAPEHRRTRPLYRLLCSSLNLTQSRCWELGAWVEGHLEENFESPLGASAARLCQRLTQTRPRDVPGKSALSRMIQELPGVRFEGSRESHEALELLWQWPGQRRTLHAALPKKGERALLISPFLGVGFVRELHGRFRELTLLSTQEALDELPEELVSRLAPERTFVLFSPDEQEDDALGQGLHAKLLLCESDEGRQAFLGSANATPSGWGLGRINGEAMLAMKPGPSISTVIRDLILEPKKGVPYRWIQQYERQPVQEDDFTRARTQLDQVHRQLSGLRLQADYQPTQRVLTLGCTNPDVAILPEGARCLVAPYLLAGKPEGFRPLSEVTGGTRYEGVTADALCEFVVIRVSFPEWELSHDFLLEIQGLLSPELRKERDEVLQQHLMEGVDGRALLFRLLGMPPPRGSAAPDGEGSGGGGWSARPSLLQELTVERVLESVAADPESMEIIESALQVLARGGRADGDLMTFWGNLKRAMEQTGWRRTHG
jgi:hypothetical protein